MTACSGSKIPRRARSGNFRRATVVDGGFLELVRYGIRKGGDPLIEDSLRVIDAVLKTHFPAGPCWRRYNHDGYGQRDDGGAFVVWGVGRPWPLLTGERGHYELAAGRDASPVSASDGEIRDGDPDAAGTNLGRARTIRRRICISAGRRERRCR